MSSNFSFLSPRDERLALLGAQAERQFAEDPVVCLFKLRQFGEVLAQTVAAKAGTWREREVQHELLVRLRAEGVLSPQVSEYFHRLRKDGNDAVHHFEGDQRAALTALKIARELGLWYHRTVTRDPAFNPGPFFPPAPPPDPTRELRDELRRLREEADARRGDAARQAELLRAEEERRSSAEERAAAVEREKNELEVELHRLHDDMAASQAATEAAGPTEAKAFMAFAAVAASRVALDERETRLLIDEKLRRAGWEADTERLRHGAGVRPQKGRSLAIAEWPTANGPADYALFVGLTPVGVVEAKRKNADVSASVQQAGRYSRGFAPSSEMTANAGPWDDGYRLPFLFSTNGRPFHRQFLTGSGIWFRDARRPTNLARALEDWPTPKGLLEEYERDPHAADEALKTQSFDFAFGLRDYQVKAIRSVESAVADGRREILIAMATGTGKTKTCIALTYRLLATKRFRRVLFLVDRNELGKQAGDAFETTHITSAQTFAEIFGLKKLTDTETETDTKVHIATVQAMVARVVNHDGDDDVPPVDEYDCVVIDECHRGYTLDREMGDEELAFRDEGDYVSKYRRVLDHFDAVKIGLTATPALHTREIFGTPVFTYSYREAVVDGWLIDHDTPLTPLTRLKAAGIAWAAGEIVDILDTGTGAIDPAELPDELAFEVKDFNTKVVTREFNRVVAGWLAEKIDPSLPGKTLVFAADDLHADIVVDELKKAFQATYGEVEDAAVRKITGKADKPGDLVKRFKNERLPSVAVTVDLLSTGIDVPEIVNIVFIRRVRSRILYEQMIGRATRQCEEIGKTEFRIFDAVGLYAAMEAVTSMRPAVADPNVTFSRLVEELSAWRAEAKPDEAKGRYLLEQFAAKAQRRRRAFTPEARGRFVELVGQPPEDFIRGLRDLTPEEAAETFAAHPDLIDVLDGRGRLVGPGGSLKPISEHPDEPLGEEEGYGTGTSRPEDYLEAFSNFIHAHINDVPALAVVVQRPRDLTRAQLRELVLFLDQNKFRERDLDTATARTSDAVMAARVIGHIRRVAVGDPLIPYDRRVDDATTRLIARHGFTGQRREWLRRIAAQMKHEVVVDKSTLDAGQFRAEAGGFQRLDRVFGGKLEELLGELGDEVWAKTA